LQGEDGFWLEADEAAPVSEAGGLEDFDGHEGVMSGLNKSSGQVLDGHTYRDFADKVRPFAKNAQNDIQR
jgi:hypothetical protein